MPLNSVSKDATGSKKLKQTFIGGGCWRKDAVDEASELAQPMALLPGDCRRSGFGGNMQLSGVMAWTDDSDAAAAALRFCTNVGSATSSTGVV